MDMLNSVTVKVAKAVAPHPTGGIILSALLIIVIFKAKITFAL